MKLLLIYPKWEKLDRQTRFTLPPHGPVVMAAALPADVEVRFIDENVEPIDFDAAADLVCFFQQCDFSGRIFFVQKPRRTKP